VQIPAAFSRPDGLKYVRGNLLGYPPGIVSVEKAGLLTGEIQEDMGDSGKDKAGSGARE
jgi:hypothetical protein